MFSALRLVLAVRYMATVVIVVGSLVATRSLGVSGVAWAYLAAEALSAIVLLAPTVLWLRGVGHRRVDWPETSPGGEISA